MLSVVIQINSADVDIASAVVQRIECFSTREIVYRLAHRSGRTIGAGPGGMGGKGITDRAVPGGGDSVIAVAIAASKNISTSSA